MPIHRDDDDERVTRINGILKLLGAQTKELHRIAAQAPAERRRHIAHTQKDRQTRRRHRLGKKR